MEGDIYCCICKQKIYRKYFVVNDKIYCNMCLRQEFMKDINDKEDLKEAGK